MMAPCSVATQAEHKILGETLDVALDGLVQSIGLEHPEDLLGDVRQVLGAVKFAVNLDKQLALLGQQPVWSLGAVTQLVPPPNFR